MISAAITYFLLFLSLYFEVFLLVAFLDRKLTRKASPILEGTASELPTTAIIVPCFNEEKTLAATLHSLLSLEYPHGKLEIIVVDDGSTDQTFAVAQEFENSATGAPRVRVFSKENGGKHTAMNFALARTNAMLIGCLDADSTVASDALWQIAPLFATEPMLGAVVPSILVKNPHTILQHLQHVEYRLSVFNRFIQAVLGSAFITPGPFSIFRADVVKKLDGWHAAHSTEDMELALRLQQHGYIIGNAPRAVVLTNAPPTLKRLFNQRVRWTYGFLRNIVDYRSMVGNRSYGNLGVMILPAAVISIGTGLYFFARILLNFVSIFADQYTRIQMTGTILPHPSFSLFYINTSAMLFIVWAAVLLILLLIAIGSYIGTGKRLPPAATPLFLAFYSFLVPLWIGTALVRAVFKTGVRWR